MAFIRKGIKNDHLCHRWWYLCSISRRTMQGTVLTLISRKSLSDGSDQAVPKEKWKSSCCYAEVSQLGPNWTWPYKTEMFFSSFFEMVLLIWMSVYSQSTLSICPHIKYTFNSPHSGSTNENCILNFLIWCPFHHLVHQPINRL